MPGLTKSVLAKDLGRVLEVNNSFRRPKHLGRSYRYIAPLRLTTSTNFESLQKSCRSKSFLQQGFAGIAKCYITLNHYLDLQFRQVDTLQGA